MGARNDGVGIRNVPVNVGDGHVCADRKFGLDADSQQWPYRSDGTHIDDMKNSVEVRPPNDDGLFIVLRVELPRDPVPLTPFGDVPLDVGHSPVVGSTVSESLIRSIAGWTHIVNCPIASNTDWLS